MRKRNLRVMALPLLACLVLGACKRDEVDRLRSQPASDAGRDVARHPGKDARDGKAEIKELKSWRNQWPAAKEKLKARYAQLDDADLVYEQGKEEVLFGRLQQKLGITRAQAEELLDSL